VITLPVLFFDGQLPQSHYIRTIADYKSGYHDVHIANLFLQGVECELAVKAVLSEGFMTKNFVKSVFDKSVTNTAEREKSANVDIRVTDIYQNYGLQRVLFHSINHPNRFVFARVLSRVAGMLGRSGDFPEVGNDYLNQVIIPPYPSVAKCLGLSSETRLLDHYRVNDDPETAHSFLSGIYAHYRDCVGAEALSKSFASNSSISEYLHHFTRSL
jgi:hypothetical protein